MNFWEFLDKRLNALRVDHVAGAGVFLLTGLVFFMLRDEPELADNDLFKTLAQAVVVQGLVGLAMAAWFTKRASTDEPQKVEIDQPSANPVPVTEQKGGITSDEETRP